MPELLLYGGSKVSVPDAEDIAAIVSGQLRERYRGVKWMRLPATLQGTAAASKITLGDSQGPPLGPDQGYAWSLTRLVVEGMTTGSTPDVINLYRNAVTGQAPLWQFNGNNFAYAFNPGQLVMQPGDSLKLSSVGTFASTSLIRLTGEYWEVPAEMLAKLVMP
jgi:hypothetical protein